MRYKVWTSGDIGSIAGEAFGGEAVKLASAGGESVPKLIPEGGESIAKFTGLEPVTGQIGATEAPLYRYNYTGTDA